VGKSYRNQEPKTTSPPKNPFIVDMPAPMLTRNTELSRNARNLWGTLRGLADGKTGELRIKGQWMKATYFDRKAEMCKNTRLPAMRELIATGYVTVKRPRVWRMIGGRMRAVAGPTQYTVHREPAPRIDQQSKDSSKVHLQESISSTVQKMDSQFFSNPPLRADGSVFSEHTQGLEITVESNHQRHLPADDEFSASSFNNMKTEKARGILLGRGHDPLFVDIALARVVDLAEAKKKIPRSAEYFVTSVERALSDPQEYAEIDEIIALRTET
jgi:hypothetical protein